MVYEHGADELLSTAVLRAVSVVEGREPLDIPRLPPSVTLTLLMCCLRLTVLANRNQEVGCHSSPASLALVSIMARILRFNQSVILGREPTSNRIRRKANLCRWIAGAHESLRHQAPCNHDKTVAEPIAEHRLFLASFRDNRTDENGRAINQ